VEKIDAHGHKEVHLKEDFYAVSFVGMMKRIKDEYEVSP